MSDALPAGLFANHLPEVAALARLWFLEHMGHMSAAATRVEAVR